jgi:hypothetical protein
VSSRDTLFERFARGLFVVLLAYMVGMMAVLIWGDSSTASKMLSAFSAMFAGILGLGSGYLLGRSVNGEEHEAVASAHE